MPIEITPVPSPEERAALEQAVRSLVERSAAERRGQWWQAGVRENVLDEDGQSSEP